MKYRFTKKGRDKLCELREKRWSVDTALTIAGKIAEDGVISERELLNKAGIPLDQASVVIDLLKSLGYIETTRGEE